PKSPTESATRNKVYFHKIGTNQQDDILMFEPPDNKEWLCGAYETEDERYLVIQIFTSSAGNNRVYVKDLQTNKLIRLLDKEDAHWSVIDNEGSLFWFFTDKDAPRGKVVSIDVSKSSDEHLEIKEVIAQPTDAHTIMENVSTVGGRFFVAFSKDVHSNISEFKLDGTFIREVKLPGMGSASGFHGRTKDTETYYSFTSYTQPNTIYRYDIATGVSTVYFAPNIDIDSSKYTSKLVFATSKDGTQVPLFISYRKGLKRNGNNPTYLYGYGGFGVSLGPAFSAARTMWMDLGGIYAEAILRGGGEYGDEWHKAGTKERKQNVFNDFIACAEWLIAYSYTSRQQLAIAGGSNGGLLVGACMTQRPDLFGACLPAVGVMDMLRFDKFTGGKFWRDDYGSAEASKEEFNYLYAYSPYHNVKKGTCYPPTYVETADHDDRVVPAHSYKFTAALQRAQAGNAPCLIRIERNAGHGSGKPLSMQIQSIADRYGSLVKTFKIPNRKLLRLKSTVK
ncbi:MAG: prolyl oligopeptidase family serine peptidase, partial [Candidatus Obscuribacterales bacterium]|nr:prolyl oligopeptidase family serine peptidase [Candidatus Obscuribacterales bacterium]